MAASHPCTHPWSTDATIHGTPQSDSETGGPEGNSEKPGPLERTVLSRRSFLSQLGAAGVTVSVRLLCWRPHPSSRPFADSAARRQGSLSCANVAIATLNVNGEGHHLQLDPRTTLLDCLRENLNLPGTKKGCDHGQCGACTVHVNGRRVNSCLSFAIMHAGDRITTIEGLGSPDKLHPMQAAFVEHDAYQCGYCTSGQIMSAVAAVKEPLGPSDDDVKHAMYGNICRCGAYPNIVAAVQQVRNYS